MAEKAMSNAEKGKAGIESIMTGEKVMEVATGSKKAPEAPYEMIGDKGSPTPTAESYAKEEAPRSDKRKEAPAPDYDERAFNNWMREHGKLKTFEATLAAYLAYEAARAKKAMSRIKPKSRIIQNAAKVGQNSRKSRKSDRSRQDDEQDGQI